MSKHRAVTRDLSSLNPFKAGVGVGASEQMIPRIITSMRESLHLAPPQSSSGAFFVLTQPLINQFDIQSAEGPNAVW